MREVTHFGRLAVIVALRKVWKRRNSRPEAGNAPLRPNLPVAVRKRPLESADEILDVWSLALIGNASGQSFEVEQNLDPRRFR